MSIDYYNYKKFYILYVDDEEKSLKYFGQAFGEKFAVLTAANAEEGYFLLRKHRDQIAILMTDQRMPGEKGIQLLEKARLLKPQIVRILVTAYSDLEIAIESVNTGAIYKYISKPWDIPLLEVTLKRGLEFFMVQAERDQLLREKMSVLQQVMITDRILSLGILAAGLGHHIRNSMVAVKTFLDLAPRKLREENLDLEQLRNPDFWKEYYVKVQGQMDKVVNLLSDLGESSEKPSFQFPNRLRPNAVVQEAFGKLKDAYAQKKIKFEDHLPDTLPFLYVDGPKFHKLFEMLLQEELASTPTGGVVTIAGRALGGGDLPQEVEITVSDSGPGIPSEALRSVFDPFYVRSGNPHEVGLALMTCFFITYHHGGKIEARTSGKGVSYILTFPAQPEILSPSENERDLFKRVLLNEAIWEKLLSGE